MRNIKRITALLVFSISLVCSGAGVTLEPDARWQLEFPELPDTLATVCSGEKQPARLTARLPSNYAPSGRFPLCVFINGGDGGRGDTLPLDRKTVGSNDFVCVNLPLFKRAYDKADGALITVNDFETLSHAYRVMVQKLLETVPNITPERSAIGGFSNGAHAVALLLAGADEFLLSHFQSFYIVEGGSPLAANALGRPALKHCRFLLMRGDQNATDLERKAYVSLTHTFEYVAQEHGLDFTSVIMRGVEHDLPPKYQVLLGQWIRGEKISETEQK